MFGGTCQILTAGSAASMFDLCQKAVARSGYSRRLVPQTSIHPFSSFDANTPLVYESVSRAEVVQEGISVVAKFYSCGTRYRLELLITFLCTAAMATAFVGMPAVASSLSVSPCQSGENLRPASSQSTNKLSRSAFFCEILSGPSRLSSAARHVPKSSCPVTTRCVVSEAAPAKLAEPAPFRAWEGDGLNPVGKRTDLKKIMIFGAGPIVIGQACEFDYSGTQVSLAARK